MDVSARSLGDALADAAGPHAAVASGERHPLGAVDGCAASWVVAPARVDAVAGVLELARREGLVVVPRGSGSMLELGRPPRRIDVVLDVTRLDRIIEYNPDELTVSVEAGLTAGALAERLAARRQWLPVDPPGWSSRTLGGLVATNACGPLRARYGTLRDLLLGVRFVQADGVLTWGGARVVKSVTGYDVPKLMVGALGTLGVLVELTLRLHPRPEHERTWLVRVDSAGAAQAFADRLLDSALQPNRVEFLNAAALSACALRPAPAALAVAIGSVEDAVREQGERLRGVAGACGAAIEDGADDFWSRYDLACRPRRGDVVLRVGTLPSRCGDTVAELDRRLAARPAGAPARVTGSLASGTIRALLADPAPAAARQLVDALRRFVDAVGGSVVVEAGPAEVRTEVDPWGPVDRAAFEVMRRIKHQFDPTGVLNPGRFVGGL